MKTILGVSGWDLNEYAISANAILGIRDSGKTYTGTEAAEELFDAGVPFIAFDPIGVWHSLRVPGKGKGYPVVVAGGRHGDLPLTRKNAGAIVRAAMSAGVSLVLDLFSAEMSKADWRAIVRECVEILLHENIDHGVRHVFIEEAAEFVPQRIRDGLVFDAVERLVRMGGNSKLGCTLINQRSADLNKSVLELCANVFVHRQTGKNTLLDLKKWFEVMALTDAEQKRIAESLPDLKSGQCWALINDLKKPVLLRIPEKNSQHPDRRAVTAKGDVKRSPVPATAFVEQMKAKLAEKDKPKPVPAPPIATSKPVEKTITADLKAQERALAAAREERAEAVRSRIPAMLDMQHKVSFEAGFNFLAARRAIWEPDFLPERKPIPMVQASIKSNLYVRAPVQAPIAQRRELQTSNLTVAGSIPAGRTSSDLPQLRPPSGSPGQRILDGLRELEAMGVMAAPRVLVAMMAGYSNLTSKGFVNAIGALRSGGQVEYLQDGVALTPAGRAEARDPEMQMTTTAIQARIVGLLGGASGKILGPLIEAYPSAMGRQDVAAAAGYGNVTSKGFVNAIGRLRTLGFVEYPTGGEVAASRLLFPEASK